MLSSPWLWSNASFVMSQAVSSRFSQDLRLGNFDLSRRWCRARLSCLHSWRIRGIPDNPAPGFIASPRTRSSMLTPPETAQRMVKNGQSAVGILSSIDELF